MSIKVHKYNNHEPMMNGYRELSTGLLLLLQLLLVSTPKIDLLPRQLINLITKQGDRTMTKLNTFNEIN